MEESRVCCTLHLLVFSTNSILIRVYSLRRGGDGRVDDADIARVLQDATESVACSAGARSIPPCLRVIEMMAMKEARDWKICSLNDFRSFLGLKRQSFANFLSTRSTTEPFYV